MDIEEVIAKVTGQIQACKEIGEDMESASWGNQEGVLLSMNEAQALIDRIVELEEINDDLRGDISHMADNLQ